MNTTYNSFANKSPKWFLNICESRPFSIGLSIRLILMIALPLLLDDGILLKGVKYTDIDYHVFTDAADHVANGYSPYRRHTYRYTPFLAEILALPLKSNSTANKESVPFFAGKNRISTWTLIWKWWKMPKYFGKLLFCISDALCGAVIILIRRNARSRNERLVPEKGFISLELQDALWWLYNPLAINICTRGSAESFVVLLPVLSTLSVTLISYTVCSSNTLDAGLKKLCITFIAGIAGFIHGLAVHSKIYPIIYTLSYMAHFSYQEQSVSSHESQRDNPSESKTWKHNISYEWGKRLVDMNENRNLCGSIKYLTNCLLSFAKTWTNRIFCTTSSLVFFLSSVLTFFTVTYIAFLKFGMEALEEGLLYHISRTDHRHNYSMFWYWIYLVKGRQSLLDTYTTILPTLGRLLMLPQAILLALISLGLAPFDLPFALFVQTFIFVVLNKVITAQYFTWYFCLIPLCCERIKWNNRPMKRALALVGIGFIMWLSTAFSLEMLGKSVHRLLWILSIFFAAVNCNLLRCILKNYKGYLKSNHVRNDKKKI